MELFRAEIEEKRNQHFPYYLPSQPTYREWPKPPLYRFQPKQAEPVVDIDQIIKTFRQRKEAENQTMMALQLSRERPVLTTKDFHLEDFAFSLSPLSLPHDFKIDIDLSALMDNHRTFREVAIEQLTAYRETIPRQNWLKLFSKPPVFHAISNLLNQLKTKVDMVPQVIINEIQAISNTLSLQQREPLNQVIKGLQEILQPLESVHASPVSH